MAALLMVACQKEELHEGPCKVRFIASVQDEVSVTRAETEYTNITKDNAPDFKAALYVSYGTTAPEYTMSWSDSKLSANLWLEAWTGPYWFYGYAPKNNNVTANFDNENKTLTLPSIPALTTTDWLVIKPCSTTITKENITSGKKMVSLQMDHLMAKITPCFYLDETYAKLRDIKIKTVAFFFESAHTYMATVTYNNNNVNKADDYKVAWTTPNSTAAAKTVTAFSNTDNTNLTNEAVAHGCCYIVPAQSASTLKMKVTYDVYDKSGTLTREDATATNQIKKLPTTLVAGTNYQLKIQVVPEYLYVLSDNDQESLVIP